MTDKNVFCKNCKFYIAAGNYGTNEMSKLGGFWPETCGAPQNTFEAKNYLNEYIEYKDKPININKNNDCQYFKEK